MPSKAANAAKPWFTEDNLPDMRRAAFIRYVKHLHLRFLQGLFRQCPDPTFLWSEDLDNTRIVITGEAPVDLAKYGVKPAITTVLGPIAFNSVALDDMSSLHLQTGQKRRALLLAGTMSINCVSSVPQESQDIAMFVAESIIALRDVLLQSGFHQIGVNLQVGAVSRAGALVANDGGKQWYATTVFSPFYMQRMVSTTPINTSVGRSVSLWLQGTGEETYESPDPPVLPLSSYGRQEPVVEMLEWVPAPLPGRPGVLVEQQFEGVPSGNSSVGEYRSSGGLDAIQVLIGEERNQ